MINKVNIYKMAYGCIEIWSYPTPFLFGFLINTLDGLLVNQVMNSV